MIVLPMRAWVLALAAPGVLLLGVDGALAQGFYLGLHGGLNLTHDGDVNDFFFFDTDKVGEADYDGGFAVGGALGYGDDHWRVEFELTYRRNAFDEIEWSDFGKVGTFATDGEISSLALMANGFWDVPTGSRIVPYLGAGLGVAFVTFDDVADADGPLFDEQETGLAFQLGAGVGYAITEAVTVSLDYRFFFVGFLDPGVDPGHPGIGGEEFGIEYTNSSLLLGLRYRF